MRSRELAVLCCIGLSAACAQDGAVGNTEIKLTIDSLDPQSSEPIFEADRVDYRITCVGTDPSTAPIPPSGAGGAYDYDDSVDISGSFQIDDESDPPVWQTVTNLPPGPCAISLSVFRGGAVVCLGSDSFTVSAQAATQLDISILCDLSVEIPSGFGETDGRFNFRIGNQCPKLFDFGAHPYVVPDSLSTTIQTVARDLDDTCGDRCDPQVCDSSNPPVCTPGPDDGLVTTLSSSSGVGTFDDVNVALATFTCDPFFPGPHELCVVASDGDWDCDKANCITVICPDLCEGVVCDDDNECTSEYCNPATGSCVSAVAPNGIACSACTGTCQGGACDLGMPYTADQVGANMLFQGSRQNLTTTLVNPYSGASVPISGNFNVNTSSYLGIGSPTDAIVGTAFADVLFVHDPVGTQRVCGVELIVAQNNLDVMLLADQFISLQGMTVSGGNEGDVIWTNSNNDWVAGNNGDDILDGGPGDDLIEGGAGLDLITWWPGAGTDMVSGGESLDTFQMTAVLSQVEVAPAADPAYEFDIFYLGTLAAQLVEVESLVLLNGAIDLTQCVAGDCALCGNDDLNGGEECDDGNLIDGDGCSATCTGE